MKQKRPTIRFKEFSEPWKILKGEELFASRREKSDSQDLKLYSVTLENGLVPRSSLERKMKDDAQDNLIARKNDIVYNMMRMWQGAMGIASQDCLVSPAYVVLIPKKNVSPLFYFTLLKTKKYLHLLKSYSYGITDDRLRLYYKDYSKIKLPYTSINEQEKIALFLSAIDKKIKHLNRTKELLAKYKKAVLQKIFHHDVRFKEESKKPYRDWVEKRLSEVLIEHKTKSTGNEEVFSVSVHKGLVNQIEHLGRSFAAESTAHYNLVKPNDIVYTKSPTGNFPYGIIKQSLVNKNVIVSPLYGVFTPATPELGYILNVYFESEINVHNYLHSIIKKGAKNTINITNATFLSKKLTLPASRAEEVKIAEFLRGISKRIDQINCQIERVKEFKKGLLQQMFV